jgi:hypothetical protein
VAAAVLAEHKLSVAEPAPAGARWLAVAVRRLEVVEAVKADLPEADNRDNMAAASSSKAVVEADMEGVYPEVHAICNNHTLTPSTSPLRLVSKSIGNIHNTIVRRQPLSA